MVGLTAIALRAPPSRPRCMGSMTSRPCEACEPLGVSGRVAAVLRLGSGWSCGNRVAGRRAWPRAPGTRGGRTQEEVGGEVVGDGWLVWVGCGGGSV